MSDLKVVVRAISHFEGAIVHPGSPISNQRLWINETVDPTCYNLKCIRSHFQLHNISTSAFSTSSLRRSQSSPRQDPQSLLLQTLNFFHTFFLLLLKISPRSHGSLQMPQGTIPNLSITYSQSFSSKFQISLCILLCSPFSVLSWF